MSPSVSSNCYKPYTMKEMDKIPSFTIDHNKLLRGIYVSRKDQVGGETVTTFDIRMKEPNRDLKMFRLVLAQNVGKIIKLGMGLLGIEVPERM